MAIFSEMRCHQGVGHTSFGGNGNTAAEIFPPSQSQPEHAFVVVVVLCRLMYPV